jgi:16S rRNA (uracil1498-N3)-methyltransferase
MRPGNAVAVFDGSGLEFSAVLESDDSGSLAARIVDTRRPDTEPSTRLTIIQGIPKGDKLELILQKCTELGAAEFLITSTERSVPKIPQDRVHPKLERWRTIVREAAEQSGRVRLPVVDGMHSLSEALGRVRGRGAILIAWEQKRGAELLSVLHRLTGVTDVALMIGPEGGLTPAEVKAAIEAGGEPISLGPRILRTETAAIAASTMLIYGLERQPA